jgi:hypothetical protein
MPDLSRGLLTVLACVVLASCGTPRPRRAEYKDGWWSQRVGEGGRALLVSYRAGALGSDWKPNRDYTADFSFYNLRLGATIYGDTSCGRRYEDAPLTVLINHLVLGFTDVQTVSQTERELASRGAMERIAHGRLDGAPISLGLTVVRKGPCVFDLVLIAPPTGFEESLIDYRTFVDGFEARVRREGDVRRAGSRRAAR